ncbi:hypothetical protein ABES58_26570 [Paenibacillus lautus]|uniref:hypothetical protein n=1 Tax=Paenibacillus lautus TaxID=1401 RepID=UPI003D2C8246
MYFKKILASTIMASLVLSGTAMAASKDSFKLPANMHKLTQKQIDVTGDKKADVITLYGQKEKASDIYNEELLLVIKNSKTKQITSISLHDGGYSPKLLLQDLTHDKVSDIMVTADTGGSGGYISSHIYTLKNGKPTELPLPGFSKGKTGLLGTGFIKLKPVALNKSGFYALQGVERDGTNSEDTTSYVTSNWKWNKGGWKLLGEKIEKLNNDQKPSPEMKSTLYKNTKANFGLEIPSSWSGHYKVKHVKSDSMFPSAKHVVYFDYISKDKQDAQSLAIISVYAQNDWKRLSNVDKNQIGSVIGEGNGMVYAVTLPQSNPYDLQSVDGKKFEQMYKDLSLRRTFSILKK